MSDKLKIAALQMISGPRVEANLQVAEALIAEAVAQGAKLLVLPEYFPLIGASDTERLAARECDVAAATAQADAPIQAFLQEMARRYQICLIGGSLPLQGRQPDKLLNSCLVYGAQGQRLARYDKVHLFGFQRGAEHYDERQTIEAGDQIVCFDLLGDLAKPLRVGLGICYDLRFPELFRAMGAVDLLVIPAAFTETTGRAHWELLLRTRAVENQCYVLAAAQGGQHPTGRLTHGNSMLIDPWGEVLARIDKGNGVVCGELDLARIAEVRASLPALQHRIFR